jgi:hypothetical protein
MTLRNRIVFKIISAVIAGLLLFALTFFITSIDLIFILFGLTCIATLIFALSLILDKIRKTELAKTTVYFALTFIIWFVATLVCDMKGLIGQSTTEYVVEKIDDFKKEFGHYPFCKDSNELIDSVGLNLNYISPEDFSYKLNKDSNYYIVGIYENDKSLISTYDSRTKQETKKKK